MCASRLALDSAGRLVVIASTADSVTQPGDVFLVLDPHGIGLFEPRGRRPTAREQAEARPPYESPRSTRWNKPAEVPDDEFDEKAAVAAAYAEQRRTPERYAKATNTSHDERDILLKSMVTLT